MNATYSIASVAELMGEPARAAILVALLDGRSLPAGELARLAGISAQSASGHLSKMIDGGLLAVQNGGRHRYYRLANAEVGHALEALGSIGTRPRNSPKPLSRDAKAMRDARSCYDHLAGRLGVELAAALEKAEVICPRGEREYQIGRKGARRLGELGIDVEQVQRAHRSFALQCVDWTERRPHVAGALGAALLARLIAMGWMARRGDTRALRITHRGTEGFRKEFGISL